MAGRRPKSRLLKLVTGNPGKRPLRADEPQAIEGWPEKPPLGAVAGAEWDRLAKLLESEQRLTTSDGAFLAGAARAYENALEIQKRQAGAREHIATWLRLKAAERMAWEHYRKFLNDLCLSQGTRARAKTTGGKPKSALEAFLTGQRKGRP